MDREIKQLSQRLCRLDRAIKIARVNDVDSFLCEDCRPFLALTNAQFRKRCRPMSAKAPFGIPSRLAVPDKIESGNF